MDECAHQFTAEGWWNHALGLREWRPSADEAMQNEEFWQTLHGCLGRLPNRVATVFTLREVDEVSSKEICRLLNVSESNLWVMLHRARMALRECLERRWFERPTPVQSSPGPLCTNGSPGPTSSSWRA